MKEGKRMLEGAKAMLDHLHRQRGVTKDPKTLRRWRQRGDSPIKLLFANGSRPRIYCEADEFIEWFDGMLKDDSPQDAR